MMKVALYVWLIVLIILFIGTKLIYFVIANAIVILLVYIFKPEWLDL